MQGDTHAVRLVNQKTVPHRANEGGADQQHSHWCKRCPKQKPDERELQQGRDRWLRWRFIRWQASMTAAVSNTVVHKADIG